MNIEIEITGNESICFGTVKVDGKEIKTLPFFSVETARAWAKKTEQDIKAIHHAVMKNISNECDCSKCKKEAKTAKPEPEGNPGEPKPNPDWTPEVGMMIQSEQYGVWEITGILTGCASLERVSDRLRGSLPNCELVKYRPIAELEGLRVDDPVYAVDDKGNVSEYKCTGYNTPDTIWIGHCLSRILLNKTGVPYRFGNGKQMFWRTAERAERFGK